MRTSESGGEDVVYKRKTFYPWPDRKDRSRRATLSVGGGRTRLFGFERGGRGEKGNLKKSDSERGNFQKGRGGGTLVWGLCKRKEILMDALGGNRFVVPGRR